MTTETWYRGETIDKVLTVATDGELRDLSVATGIELQVKSAPDADDPPLISLAIGYGITLRAQSGATLGQADVTISSAQVDALAPGVYYYDVAVDFPGPERKYVVKPTKVIVKGVVNRPSATPPPAAPSAAPQDQTERSFTWTAPATLTTHTIVIPGLGMRDASYAVAGFHLRDPAAGDGAHPDARFPAAGRTATQFQVTTDAPIRAGSVYDIVLRDA